MVCRCVENEKHLYKPWKHGGEAIGSRRSLAPANVGGTSLHLDRCAPPFGEFKTFSKSFEGVRGALFQKCPPAHPFASPASSRPLHLPDKPQFIPFFSPRTAEYFICAASILRVLKGCPLKTYFYGKFYRVKFAVFFANITKKSRNFHLLFYRSTALFIVCLQLYGILL